MKKIFLLSLFSFLCFSLGLIFSAPKTLAAEVTDENNLEVLLSSYYGDGTYKKDTKINVDAEKVGVDLQTYFHAEVMVMERSTYYTKDALWMSREKETNDSKYSYYGTSYDGETPNGLTNATADYPLVAPENAGLALSGTNQNSMEEHYVTLHDFIQGSHTSSHTDNETIVLNEGWSVDENGVYSNVNSDVLDGFRLFTAPLWLGKTEKNANYITYTKATIQEVDAKLVMKLWVSSEEVGKLVDGVEADSEGNLLFSEAVISKKQYSDNLQGRSENLQADIGTDFEGYDPVENANLFDGVASSPSGSAKGTFYKDSLGRAVLGYQNKYQGNRLVKEKDGNIALKMYGTSDSAGITRAGLDVSEELLKAGTYKASIKLKLGPNANDIRALLFKFHDKGKTSGMMDGNKVYSSGLYFNNYKEGERVTLSKDEWTTLEMTYTLSKDITNVSDLYIVFIAYTMNYTLKDPENYLLVDDLEFYRLENRSNFEGYNSTDNPELFGTDAIDSGVADTNAAHYKWFTDNDGNNTFAIQYGYTSVRLHEEADGNVALKACGKGSGKLIRVGINVNNEISSPGLYKATIKVKGGPNANNVGNISFRFHSSTHLYASGGLAYPKSGIYFRTNTGAKLEEEWITLEVEFVVTEPIKYKNDLIIVLMVYTYNSGNNPENYVLVDDLEIFKVEF